VDLEQKRINVELYVQVLIMIFVLSRLIKSDGDVWNGVLCLAARVPSLADLQFNFNPLHFDFTQSQFGYLLESFSYSKHARHIP
jgi:hypothetical protein